MARLLCMSHGPLAKGMVETSQYIIGENDRLDYLCAYIDGNDNLSRIIDEYLENLNGETLIVITDIFGGSINNEWMGRLPYNNNLYLIAGMNLGLVVELLTKIEQTINFKALIQKAMTNSVDSFKFCNDILFEEDSDDF